jgi:hypothetical protein
MDVLLIVVGLAFAVPILWTVSVGAVREARRLRAVDPREGCQAWVTVPGLRGRVYRCGVPVYAGGSWCLRHELSGSRAEADPDVTAVDQPQEAGRALVRARVGIPLAVVTLLALVATTIWLVQRSL